jgi:mannose-6-phosphate isomerase-like protein (cupin superfamily)
MPASPPNLTSTYLRLRTDASMEPLPVDDEFWRRIGSGELGSFHNEYLVTMHTIDVDFPIWEMHPMGEEVICLLAGKMTITLDIDGEQSRHLLDAPGTFILVPRGAWHTATVHAPVKALFITAGEGTQHRERN